MIISRGTSTTEISTTEEILTTGEMPTTATEMSTTEEILTTGEMPTTERILTTGKMPTTPVSPVIPNGVSIPVSN